MRDAPSNDNTIHLNNAFTELFNLLKKVKSRDESLALDYTHDEISKILSHTDNAVTSLLHGLQSIGNLIALSSLSNKDDITQIGYFLTLIGNLMEALNILRSDCELQLFTEPKHMIDAKKIDISL
jgi:hypothetical protein